VEHNNAVLQSNPPAVAAEIEEPKRLVRKPKAKRKSARKQHGFSLLEMVVVVSVMLLIAAIALPSFIRARVASANGNLASSTRSLISAIGIYSSTYNQAPASLSVLGDNGTSNCSTAPASAAGACAMNQQTIALMTSATGFNGATWAYTAPTATTGWSVVVTPIAGATPTRSFFSNGEVITYSDSGAATITSPVLGN
jgi:type IV pilus assembly protein PilA